MIHLDINNGTYVQRVVTCRILHLSVVDATRMDKEPHAEKQQWAKILHLSGKGL